jgi:hypothetical protein
LKKSPSKFHFQGLINYPASPTGGTMHSQNHLQSVVSNNNNGIWSPALSDFGHMTSISPSENRSNATAVDSKNYWHTQPAYHQNYPNYYNDYLGAQMQQQIVIKTEMVAPPGRLL